MTFQNELKSWMTEYGISRKQASILLGASKPSICQWINKPGVKPHDKQKYLNIMRNTEVYTKTMVNEAPPVSKPTQSARAVRVAFPVQTLSEVIEKALQYKEVILEENGKLFKVISL